ncbi:MAG: ABC transporter ATP-binding protein [SAR202 cluster bacterium]|jgi:putative ABC transport system ATP-binding protein|nr:ABC transporter ATP-binding protein [SAR202 cluster bacterium]
MNHKNQIGLGNQENNNSPNLDALICLKDVTKQYRIGAVTIRALNGINLAINSGEFVAITGPSGSGKSTVMNLLGCLDGPTSGNYFLQGVNVSGLSDRALSNIRNKQIGFVFQTYNLLPRLSAVENVELPLVYAGESRRREKALNILERVGLKERSYHRPSELSGGQQQRAGIARALVTDPTILLADEPSGNLDSRTTKEILDLISGLNADYGQTIILVTHEAEVAARASRQIHMVDGLIVRDTADAAVEG